MILIRLNNISGKIFHSLCIRILLFNLLAFPSFSQDCNIISKANNIVPDGLCAPVTVQWEVVYRGVNNNGTPVRIQFDWNDGNPVQVVNATLTDPVTREWTATVNHTYPKGGNQCNYNPNSTLIVNGVLCTSTIQEQNVTVWDTDDENGGEMQIDPEIYYICVGNSGCTDFQDVSQWNCEPPDENDVPNTPKRWIQWIYGTSYSINNVTVDGVVETYPFTGPIQQTFEPIFGPSAPWNQSEVVCAPATGLVGQFFQVNLRNWNYCNPYDDPNTPGLPADPVNGDFPPVITTAMILIVDTPNATINPAGPFCSNHASVKLTAATGGGIWSGPGITNPNNGTFSPGAAGPGVHTIKYTVTDAHGCIGRDTIKITVFAIPKPDILPGATAEVCPGDNLQLDGNPTPGSGTIITHLWTGNTSPLNNVNIQNPIFNTNTQGTYNLTYTVTDNNGCYGTDQITVYVRPVNANIIPDPANVCAGKNLNLNGNPSGGTGVYTTHFWTGDTGPLNNVNIQTPVFNTITPGVYNLTYTVTDNKGCTDSDNISVTVYQNPLANAGGDDSICGLSYSLKAIKSIGTGTWTKASGPGTVSFSNDHLATTNVTVSLYGAYQLVWSETYGPNCTDRDTVHIVFIRTPVSYAGPDDSICGLTFAMNAVASVGTGSWMQLSGPGTVIFNNPASPSTGVTADTWGSYSFIWKEDNTFGCMDQDTVVIGFELIPDALYTPQDTNRCSPFYIQFNNLSTGADTYIWTFGDGNSTSNQNPMHIFTNNTPFDISYEVKLVVRTSFGCKDSVSHQVTVNPIPESDFSSDAVPACSPLTVHFTNKSKGSILHIWNYGDGSPDDTALNPTHTFINDTTLIQYFPVRMIAISSNGCPDTIMQYITVFPDPDYHISVTPDSSCHPALVQIMATPGGSSYYWYYGDGTFEKKTFYTTHTYTNSLKKDTTYHITVIVSSVFSCIDTSTTQVTVHPKPSADFSISPDKGCTPLEVTLTNESKNEKYSYWDFGDGSKDTLTDSVFTHIYVNSVSNPVSHTIRLIVETEHGCSDSMEKTITVYPEVVSRFICDTAGCSPYSVPFVNQSAGAVSYVWDFGNGVFSSEVNPVHSYTNSTDTVVIYKAVLIATSAYGCKDTTSEYITVYPKPAALFTVTQKSGCSPFDAEITNFSHGADDYLWIFGDGDSSQVSNTILHHIYNNHQSTPDNYNIKLIVSNSSGCSDTLTDIITVYPDIQALFESDTAGCHPLPVKFKNLSTGASAYQWSFGDGVTSTAINPQHTYMNTTDSSKIFIATLIVTSTYKCTDTAIRNITVYPKPTALFTVPQKSGCSPFEVEITNFSHGADDYLWVFGDGDSSQVSDTILHHIYTNYQSTPDHYNLTFIVSNSEGCSDTLADMITVYPDIQAKFISDSAGCSPFTITFQNISTGASGYSWDFGDGTLSYQKNPLHLFTKNGTTDTVYHVSLSVVSTWLCRDTFLMDIRVYPSPQAIFTLEEDKGCSPFQCIIKNQSIGASVYSWDFGDGFMDNLPDSILNHTYNNKLSNPDNFEINLMIANPYGCTDEDKQSVTVYPEVLAFFTCDTTGCHPLPVHFINQTYGAETYLWDFGNGSASTQENPFYTFNNISAQDTTFNVLLIATSFYGCKDSMFRMISVYPSPAAEFSVTPVYQVYPNTTVTIDNLTNTGLWNYVWNFGDNATSVKEEPVSHTFDTWGDYLIRLTVSGSHCTDTISHLVYIIAPYPVADFDSSAQGCVPFIMHFENHSLYADSYEWDFGDGQSSQDQNPAHIYNFPGNYLVTLKASGPGGQDSKGGILITVYESPSAYFIVEPNIVYLPDQPIHCFNLSQKGYYYKWHFGDGDTSALENPTHIYKQEGVYSITLEVWTEHSCYDSYLLSPAVTAETGGEIIFPDAFTPDQNGPNGGNYSLNYEILSNNIFFPKYKGVVDFHLEVFNRWGELIFETDDIHVGWDGYYRGQLCKQDVYVWKAKGKFTNGQTFTKAGDVTLLR